MCVAMGQQPPRVLDSWAAPERRALTGDCCPRCQPLAMQEAAREKQDAVQRILGLSDSEADGLRRIVQEVRCVCYGVAVCMG